MGYTCLHCEQETEQQQAHSFTLYREDGTEDRLEILCDDCYDEWLQALKG